MAQSRSAAGGAFEMLRRGVVIPAHPLALTANRRLDVEHQRALSRYYLDAGAGGLAVGVHTTQFEIREHGLFESVLALASEEARSWVTRPIILIAGVTGRTEQAVREAHIARGQGYHAVLLNVAAFKNASESETLEHCRRVAADIPVIGFALLPAVGGVHLSHNFWRRFAQIESVVGIKIATFDRYRTIDVLRGVVDAQAEDRITVYTGNDDHILLDLLTPFALRRDDGSEVQLTIRGGLLGHWSIWTKRAVELLDRVHAIADNAPRPADLMALDARITDCNAAIYDARNDFAGCIPGCLEVLARQGLVHGTWCLNPDLVLSAEQASEIDRVYRLHPDLNDDAFVAANLDRWLTTVCSKPAVTEGCSS